MTLTEEEVGKVLSFYEGLKFKEKVREGNTVNELTIFTHPDFGSLEVWIGPDGKPWFPATECSEILKYANPREAIIYHCLEAGVAFRSVSYPSGTKKKKYINRPNLSRLIARSHLPEAAKFESWIFDDVLESVFDHGMYATPKTIEEMLEDPDTMIATLQALKSEREKRKKLEAKIDQDKPLVSFGKSIENSTGSILVREFAKLASNNPKIKTGEKRLYKWLRDKKYLMEDNEPYQQYVNNGWFEIREYPVNTSHGIIPKKTTLVTGKGQIALMKSLCKEFAVEDMAQ